MNSHINKHGSFYTIVGRKEWGCEKVESKDFFELNKGLVNPV